MPYLPLKPCLHQNCPAFVTGPGAYCPRHSRKKFKKKDPIYGTTKHQNWRKMILHRDPICKVCNENLSKIADHIQPLRQGGGWELENGQGLCQHCHTVKTKNEQEIYGS